MSFSCSKVQLQTHELWRCADRVKLLLRGSKEDQKTCGEVISHKKTVVGAIVCHHLFHILGGKADGFEVMLDLMMLYPSLDVRYPLATYQVH